MGSEKEENDSIQVNSSPNYISNNAPDFKVQPRGSATGFDQRHKLDHKNDLNELKSDTKIKNLQFGFIPLSNKEKENEVYFDVNIDTLQAPREEKYPTTRNEKISPKSFRTVSRNVHNSIRKLDKKSNLDLLGIFDTRKYFFIPQNRRNDIHGVFSWLSNIFGANLH